MLLWEQTVDQTDSDARVEHLALDWASLGRLVRRRTLEAVALHFVILGQMGTHDTVDGSSQCVGAGDEA